MRRILFNPILQDSILRRCEAMLGGRGWQKQLALMTGEDEKKVSRWVNGLEELPATVLATLGDRMGPDVLADFAAVARVEVRRMDREAEEEMAATREALIKASEAVTEAARALADQNLDEQERRALDLRFSAAVEAMQDAQRAMRSAA